MRTISSRQNQALRAFRALADEPDPTGARLLLDGAHLVRDAHQAGARFELVAVASSRLASDTEEGALAHALDRAGADVIVTSDQLFGAISPVRTPSGIMAIAIREPSDPVEICQQPGGLVLLGGGRAGSRQRRRVAPRGGSRGRDGRAGVCERIAEIGKPVLMEGAEGEHGKRPATPRRGRHDGQRRPRLRRCIGCEDDRGRASERNRPGRHRLVRTHRAGARRRRTGPCGRGRSAM